ncbi:MAG TPA: SpoIVB peptidase S55 domain-containing protein, partial [Candidatus Limnocylindria bacterium]|nr:SpoIVB peptidase S55 domain-containing protein [Candidatus Limnocylindria bacterium]
MVRAAALATLVALSASAAGVPTLSPDQLHPGQKAVVRTVFQGTKVEEFEAEIVGVLKGGRAEGDLILARATSENAVKSGVAQGMSGSPVYVDGKLIGALSTGWSFTREPLFGITPI